MEINSDAAYPLLQYRLAPSPERSDIAVIGIRVETGWLHLAATREILEKLSKDLAEQAALMPRRQ